MNQLRTQQAKSIYRRPQSERQARDWLAYQLWLQRRIEARLFGWTDQAEDDYQINTDALALVRERLAKIDSESARRIDDSARPQAETRDDTHPSWDDEVPAPVKPNALTTTSVSVGQTTISIDQTAVFSMLGKLPDGLFVGRTFAFRPSDMELESVTEDMLHMGAVELRAGVHERNRYSVGQIWNSFAAVDESRPPSGP